MREWWWRRTIVLKGLERYPGGGLSERWLDLGGVVGLCLER